MPGAMKKIVKELDRQDMQGLCPTEVFLLLDAVFVEIRRQLIDGYSVKLPGIGTLKWRDRTLEMSLDGRKGKGLTYDKYLSLNFTAENTLSPVVSVKKLGSVDRGTTKSEKVGDK